MATALYEYSALKTSQSIRLITLLAGINEDELYCNLHEAEIDDCEPYEAISYVWGNAMTEIAISSGSTSRIIRIPDSLKLALLRYRYGDKSRVMWADSICINQGDLAERSQQVRLMGDVYRKAKYVQIWLGEEDDKTAASFKGIEILVEKVWKKDRLAGDDPHKDVPKDLEGARRYYDIPGPDSMEFEGLRKLLDLPWFHRAWTFQESYLARRENVIGRQSRLRRGSFSVPSLEISKVCVCALSLEGRNRAASLNESVYLGQNLLHKVMSRFWSFRTEDSRESYEQTWDSMQLHNIVQLRRGAGCGDPRDLIYSLLGVAVDGADIEPDYSTPFEEVFGSFARRYININGDLSFLGFVSTVGRDISPGTLPSWTPDYRVSRLSRAALSSMNHSIYKATGSSKATLCPTSNMRWLSLKGILVDTIAHLLGRCNAGTILVKYVGATNLLEYPLTREPLVMAGIRTMVADQKIAGGCRGRWSDQSWRDNYEDAEFQAEHGRIATTALFNNSIFISGEARLGLVPEDSRVGDVICLFLGGQVPLVLRPDGDEFLFVGECYVHGMMDGEGLVEARKKQQWEYDGIDTLWLDYLHQEPIPFETREIVIK